VSKGRKGEREGGREGGREGRREEGREGGRVIYVPTGEKVTKANGRRKRWRKGEVGRGCQ